MPGLFVALGLTDIEVYVNDKATPVFSPYATSAQRAFTEDAPPITGSSVVPSTSSPAASPKPTRSLARRLRDPPGSADAAVIVFDSELVTDPDARRVGRLRALLYRARVDRPSVRLDHIGL